MSTRTEVVMRAREIRDRHPHMKMNHIIHILRKEFSKTMVDWFASYLFLRWAQRGGTVKKEER